VKRDRYVAQQSATIAASRELVFDLLTDDDRFCDLRPRAVAHREIEPLPNGGHTCVQEYEARGRRVAQRATCVVFDRPRQFREDLIGPGYRAIGNATFEGGDPTRVTLRQETMLVHPFGWWRWMAVRMGTEGQLAEVLARLKRVAESST
jgi:hypothetical protein